MLSDDVISHKNPKSPISEAYRVLRTNIQFTGFDNPVKLILVTSSGPSEGKSTTAANMAVTFVQSGSRVLLIDADLRKPKIHKIFGLANKWGMTNALIEPESLDKYIQHTEIENLDIITSGPIPPNPSEMLGSKKMKKFIEKIKEIYDIILIDSPPVGMVTDAQILSTIVDGTILVASSGQVTIDALKRAKGLLENVNANILGIVLNKLERESNGYYYYYYYRHYDS